MKTLRILTTALSICLAMSMSCSKEVKNIRKAILAEVKKCPKLEIQDLYKLAYQAAMGNEHMMADTHEVKRFLAEELAAVDSSSGEPLIEYLTSDSAIARINLRAFKDQKGNPAKLLAAMLKTASIIQPSIGLLRQFWSDVENLAEEGKIPFTKGDLSKYFRGMEEQSFPPVHHSKAVDYNYHPSYRIIADKQILIH